MTASTAAPPPPISDAPEIVALDLAVRAALTPGAVFSPEAVAAPMAAAIDRLGAKAVESYLRTTGRVGGDPLQLVFRRVSQRLRHTLWDRHVHAELVFAPLLLRGEDERRFPQEIDSSTAAAIVRPLRTTLGDLGRDDVLVVPFSSLYTEAELETQTPEFFHRTLRKVMAACANAAQGAAPNILQITNRAVWGDPECADLQARRPMADRLYQDAAGRAPKVTLRLLPLLVIRAPDRTTPAALAEPGWRAIAAQEIAAYASALPPPRPAPPIVRRLQAPLPVPAVAAIPTSRIAVDFLAPQESGLALRAAKAALALNVIGADAAYWLAAAGDGAGAELKLDLATGNLHLRYAGAGPHAEPPLEYAVALDAGRAGLHGLEQLRKDLLTLGFAQVLVSASGPGSERFEGTRDPWQFAPAGVGYPARLQ